MAAWCQMGTVCLQQWIQARWFRAAQVCLHRHGFEHHTWQCHWAKQRGAGSGTTVLPAKAAGAGSAHCLWHRRERRHLHPHRGGRRLGMGSTGMQGDHAALPERDLSVPQPCLPHLSLYSPDLFLLLLSRSVFFRTILSVNDAKCHPRVIEQISNLCSNPSVWLVGPVFTLEKCLLMGRLWALASQNGFVSLFGGLFPQVPLLPQGCSSCWQQHSRELGAWRSSEAVTASTERLPVALVSAIILDIIRKTISFSNFQDRGDGSWLIIGSCF